MSAPPGWYGTAADSPNVRFWDGTRWTQFLIRLNPAAQREIVTPAAVAGPGIKALDVACVSFALAVGLSALVTVWLRHLGSPGGDSVQLIANEIGLWIPLVLAPIYVSKRRGTGCLGRDFGFSFKRRDWGYGLLGSFVARGASSIVILPLSAGFDRSVRSPQIGRPVDNLHGLTLLAFALVACIGAPIVEELFFRGMIQTRLVGRLGVARGIALTSLLFGGAHLIGWQGPLSLVAAASIAGGGVVLGYVKNRSGRLGTSMVCHLFFNLFVVAVVAIGLI